LIISYRALPVIIATLPTNDVVRVKYAAAAAIAIALVVVLLLLVVDVVDAIAVLCVD
jgi:hypothetical protein